MRSLFAPSSPNAPNGPMIRRSRAFISLPSSVYVVSAGILAVTLVIKEFLVKDKRITFATNVRVLVYSGTAFCVAGFFVYVPFFRLLS